MDWRHSLETLAAHLQRLTDNGVKYLNIAPDAELEALLVQLESKAKTAAPGPPGPGTPRPWHLAQRGKQHGTQSTTQRSTRPGPHQSIANTTSTTAPPADPAAKSEPLSPSPPPSHAAENTPADPNQFDTLPALHIAFRDCHRCQLGATRTKLVFGIGHERPRLLFIGEGPGREEDLQGQPFVGRAGQLLTSGIHALGLTREDVYIANVVKCRPPENRTPTAEEIAACRPILHRQMEILQPALIVALGNVPLKVLNPKAPGITAARGTAFTYRDCPVLPTFHPAYLLRNPAGLDDWWADLRTAFTMAYGEQP